MKMRKRKKYKGMTLIEILIALAIFAMLGSLLVLAGIQIDNTMKASNKLKKKMLVEAPYAANQLEKYNVNGTDMYFATESVTINVEYKGESVDIQGIRRDTEELVKPTGMDATAEAKYYQQANSRLNFKSIEVEGVVTAPTT